MALRQRLGQGWPAGRPCFEGAPAIFAGKDGLDVFLVALGTPDKDYPPAKNLAEFFRRGEGAHHPASEELQ